MKILLTGYRGGIGSAIKKKLSQHEIICVAHATIYTVEEFDWMICAHGVINEADVKETFMANVISNIRLAQTIFTKNIIFISSTAGIKGNDKYPIYSASKAALNMYCKSIASKVNCYALCPGPTDTPMWRNLGLEGKAQSPVEVAKVVERIMAEEFKSGDIITVRNGEVNVVELTI